MINNINIKRQLKEYRRHFHQHPELSLKEFQTKQYIIDAFFDKDVEIINFAQSTSFVVKIKGRDTSKGIALRADMDALPVSEEADVECKSLNDGVMHACGHDGHIAILLTYGLSLLTCENIPEINIYLCFQAAEEINAGAVEVIDYLKREAVVLQVIGLHLWNQVPLGKVGIIDGAVMAGVCRYKVDVTGKGGHGSRQDLADDPIKAACDMVLKIASIPANFYNMLDASVVSTCEIHAGTTGNVIPNTASFAGSMRFFVRDGYFKIQDKILEMAKGIELIHGVKVDVEFWNPLLPVTNNHDSVVRAIKVVEEIEGLEVFKEFEPLCASENFSKYLETFPGVFLIVGCGSDNCNLPHHHPGFKIEEASLWFGYLLLNDYVERFICEINI